MRMSLAPARLLSVGTVLLASTVLVADGTRFSDFMPLTASAGPTADESAPINELRTDRAPLEEFATLLGFD